MLTPVDILSYVSEVLAHLLCDFALAARFAPTNGAKNGCDLDLLADPGQREGLNEAVCSRTGGKEYPNFLFFHTLKGKDAYRNAADPPA